MLTLFMEDLIVRELETRQGCAQGIDDWFDMVKIGIDSFFYGLQHHHRSQSCRTNPAGLKRFLALPPPDSEMRAPALLPAAQG